jgi:alanine racemase
MSRPSSALIDLQALRDNFSLAQSLAPNSKTMPMVKANAYGHGILPVAKALADLAPAYGVACIEEAIELRQAGIKQPILLLEGTYSADEVPIAARENFWLMVENEPQVEAITEATLKNPVNVWIKLDTGMHRLGFPATQAQSIFEQLRASSNVNSQIVLATHFAWADNLSEKLTEQQLATFKSHIQGIKHHGLLQSLANSASILGWPQTQRDWQRPGYMLYGNSPFSGPQDNAKRLKPVMTFSSAIISIRTVQAGESVGYTAHWVADRVSRIATVAVGYGDGYPRQAPNGTPVLIQGVECPIVGRVSMDMITVDITDLPDTVCIGEKVILWGPQLSVNRVAKYCNTIGYELLTRMPSRIPRIYINQT